MTMKIIKRSRFSLFSEGIIAVVAGLSILSGCGGESAAVPNSYQTYNHKDGSFKLVYPAGWEIESGGKGPLARAKFTSGDALISVSTSVAGSLKGDIAQSTGVMPGGTEGAADRQPVAQVHESEKKGFEEDESVTEKPPEAVNTGLGDGRKSEYTGSKTFGGDIHGYRATTLSRDLEIRIICECSESQWKDLKPVFDKVIESVAQGRPEP
jgi:hypothetical protein